VAQQRRWVALAELWRWIGSKTVSDGWSPAWAAPLTGFNGVLDPPGSAISNPVHSAPELGSRRIRRSRSTKSSPDDDLTIATMMERWLKEMEGEHTHQTIAQHRVAIKQLMAFQPGNVTVGSIDRRTAGEFVNTVLMAAGSTQKTVNRKISSLSSMWRWLVKRGFVDANPWTGQGTFSNRVKRGTARKRAYTAEEVCKLLRAAPQEIAGERYGVVIADLLRLGLLTGCRIGELCDIRAEDVLTPQMAFRIPDGKTENARRIMPVHRHGWPIIERRLTSTPDGWLFSGLTPAGPDAKRSWIVVKRFATFRQEVLGKDKSVDFHSLRRTFATYLERASTQTLAVNTSTIAELMGHVKPTLALAVYSSGLVPAQLRAAIDALDLVLEPEIIALLRGRAPLLSDPQSV
jgi:integrase